MTSETIGQRNSAFDYKAVYAKVHTIVTHVFTRFLLSNFPPEGRKVASKTFPTFLEMVFATYL